MSSAAASTTAPAATSTNAVDQIFGAGQQKNEQYENITIGTFFTSLGVSLVVFVVQVTVFLLLKGKLPRI